MALYARTARLALPRLPSPLRGGVGGGGQRALNFVEYPVDICQHVVIPEAKDTIAGGFDETCSRLIRYLLPIVLTAIEFNHELCPTACEINDEGTNSDLPPKMRTDQHDVVAKALPKHAFGLGRLGAHPTCKLSLAIAHGR